MNNNAWKREKANQSKQWIWGEGIVHTCNNRTQRITIVEQVYERITDTLNEYEINIINWWHEHTFALENVRIIFPFTSHYCVHIFFMVVLITMLNILYVIKNQSSFIRIKDHNVIWVAWWFAQGPWNWEWS